MAETRDRKPNPQPSQQRKPNWGTYPNVMAAALYYNRKRHRNNRGS